MTHPLAGWRLPVWAGVAANLVPLAGVVWFGWSLFGVFAVYLAETALVGVATVVRILASRGGEGRGFSAAFFCVHYGFFWVGHAVFVMAFFGSAGPLPDLRLAVASLAVSQAVALWAWLRSAAPAEASPSLEMFRPYGRVVVLHVAILGGGALLQQAGTPLFGLILLVGLKTLVEAAAVWWRRGADRPPSRGAVVRVEARR